MDKPEVVEYLKDLQPHEFVDIVRESVGIHVLLNYADTLDFKKGECDTAKQLLQIMWACKE